MSTADAGYVGLTFGAASLLLTVMSAGMFLPVTFPLAAVGMTCSAVALNTHARDAAAAGVTLNALTLGITLAVGLLYILAVLA